MPVSTFDNRDVYPLKLEGLTTREEITDVIIRACLGIDGNNKALWESAWCSSPDISLAITGRKPMVGSSALLEECLNVVGPMDTQHILTNVRVHVREGSDKAVLTANCHNQHFRAGQGTAGVSEHLLGGGIYEIDMVKENGEWKMMTWRFTITWTQGTHAVMRPA